MRHESIETNPAAHWLAHAEAEARKAQQALDDLDSLNLPARWGEVDVAGQRSMLLAARDEYVYDTAYWRCLLDQKQTR